MRSIVTNITKECVLERIMDCSQLRASYKLPLVRLASYGVYESRQDGDGYLLYPVSVSVVGLSNNLGCGRRTVQKALRAAEDLGIVKTKHKKGRNVFNEYTLDLCAIFAKLSPRLHTVVHVEKKGE